MTTEPLNAGLELFLREASVEIWELVMLFADIVLLMADGDNQQASPNSRRIISTKISPSSAPDAHLMAEKRVRRSQTEHKEETEDDSATNSIEDHRKQVERAHTSKHNHDAEAEPRFQYEPNIPRSLCEYSKDELMV